MVEDDRMVTKSQESCWLIDGLGSLPKIFLQYVRKYLSYCTYSTYLLITVTLQRYTA